MVRTSTTGTNCPRCGAPTVDQIRICASCGEDLGCPNVRLAQADEEVAELRKRFDTARSTAVAVGKEEVFDRFVSTVNAQSSVVVSASTQAALNIVTDPAHNYVNYETLVGAGMRAPANMANDAHRRVVAGTLFPTFGDELIYGALSLSCRGLSTYGDISIRLRPEAIRKRCTFLEMNSYTFQETLAPTNRPLGYIADWESRGMLAGIKFVDKLKKHDTQEQWEVLLLYCDGRDRDNDDFIEGHIYGVFNAHSIESLAVSDHVTGNNKALADLVLERFNEARN